MQNKLLSIIVPVYNVEPYLHRCIDSILVQTYTNFECILIDDGSTDNSGRICDEYAEGDKRIKVIHQQNKGVSAARNAGLNAANGEYIGFVDPDDWIEPEMYENLVFALLKNNADISCCGVETVPGGGKSNGDKLTYSIMNREQFTCACLRGRSGKIYDSIWNKCYKASMIQDLFFDEQAKICEDALFLIEYNKKISIAVYLNKVMYHNLYRADSVSHANRNNNVQALPIHNRMIDSAREIGHEPYYYAQAGYLDCCLQYADISQAEDYLGEYVKKNMFSILYNPLIKWKLKIVYFLRALRVRINK